MPDPDETQVPTERCVVCGKPFAKGEGRYRLKRGPVHEECRDKLPKDEQQR